MLIHSSHFRVVAFVKLLALLLTITFVGWLFVPRPVDESGFDPDKVADLETKMWQAYYAQDYFSLAISLWSVAYSQYGGSPWHCYRLTSNAGEAARVFQVSQNRTAAQRALPALERYYTLLQGSTGASYDPKSAAMLELEWWQLRREGVSPEEITQVLAELYAMVYKKPVNEMLAPARGRVVAMEFRDSRRITGMSDDDWIYLEQLLVESYSSLSAALSSE